MQCLILAGGLGTRIREVDSTVPKALIPVNGRPFAFHQLELLARNGITRVTYSIGFKAEQIRAAVGNGSAFGIQVDYVDEGTQLRGTGGAVRLAYDQGVLDETFFLLYGDSYLPTDYQAPWRAFAGRSEPALMTVFHNRGKFDRSNARWDGEKVFYDKQGAASGQGGFEYIDYGLSILTLECVATLPLDKSDLATLFHRLSVEDRLAGFEVAERFYEAGSPEGLRELERFMGGSK